ncbi:hypothetical protein DRP07_00230 [Archaeoglobales archaeon]|nr:MAG: hypothetical protein DRP07_00230 [Archaeoglobales archaeon]
MYFPSNETAQLINILSLGSYNDLNSLISTTETNTAATVFAWVLTVLKWGMAAFAIFSILRYVLDKLGFTPVMAVILTAIAMVGIFAFYNTPWNDASIVQSKVSGFMHAMNNTAVNYTPSLIQPIIAAMTGPISAVNSSIGYLNSSLPSNLTVPTIQGRSIASTTVNTSWIAWAIFIAIVALAIYIISRFNRLIAGIVAVVLFMVALSIPDDLIASVITIIVCAGLAYVLFRHVKILSAYPIAIAILTLAYMIQPPQAVLILMLIAVFIISLLPFFYGVGALLYGVGEIVESRERFGMKKKPKKVIEEYAGEWDPVMIALVLTLFFTGVIVLFGASLSGFGIFLTNTVALLRR